MSSTEDVIRAMRREMRPLLETAMEGVLTKARSVLEEAEQQRTQGLLEVAQEHAKGLAKVADERDQVLAEVEARRTELSHEIEAMHKHKEAQEGRVELNIGGYRFETSVETLRRVPHTFFDAYFSGRYAQDVCNDGSIFVDRDGKHFGHILEYMRDGHLSVAEPDACSDTALLRALKREFGFYCIELYAEQVAQPEVAVVIGGYLLVPLNDNEGDSDEREIETLSTIKRYDASSGYGAAEPMSTLRHSFGACAVEGVLYVSGGLDTGDFSETHHSSVEKYSLSSNSWTFVAPLPEARANHVAVAVGSAMYILGGTGHSGGTANNLMYDTVSDTWTPVAAFPEARSEFVCCAVGSDIFIFGGVNVRLSVQDSVFKYDTLTSVWTSLAPTPTTLVVCFGRACLHCGSW
jgi:hypothetical protein